MNERIQQLLIEAHKQTDGGIYTGHLSVWTEKFAELIVRECAELTLDYKSDDYYNGWLDYRDEIKRHFGVEE
jgi:hypothetical protein